MGIEPCLEGELRSDQGAVHWNPARQVVMGPTADSLPGISTTGQTISFPSIPMRGIGVRNFVSTSRTYLPLDFQL